MPDDEIHKIAEQLTNVRLDLRELSTKVDSIKDLARKLDEASNLANDALQSTKAAHKRLDSMEDNQKWIWRTAIGAIIVGAINLLLKLKGA